MPDSHPMNVYINLGQTLWDLNLRPAKDSDSLIDQIGALVHAFNSCQVPATAAAASGLRRWYEAATTSEPGTTPPLSPVIIAQWLVPICDTLQHEAGSIQLLRLNTADVSPKLRGLRTSLPRLTPSQEFLLQEVYLSIETGAYRSAIVMGWNLAYDYIRQWIFDNHLAAFQSALDTYRDKSGNPIFGQLKSYSDFWESANSPSERIVLDAALKAQAFGGKIHDELTRHLRQRNVYAHASLLQPTAVKASAYVEELTDIITNQPFC